MTNTPKISAIDKRLAAYAAVATAALATPALPNAEAIVVTNNINLAVPANIDGLYVNFLTGGTGSAAFAGWDLNVYLTNSVFTFFWTATAATNGGGVQGPTAGVYASLSPGAIINAASTFIANSGGGGAGSTINFQSTGEHILGFRFLNEATSAINYGYAVFQNTGPSGFPATLVSYSYENSGAAITVVPEPSTYALFGAVALGALGLREWRRRKAA